MTQLILTGAKIYTEHGIKQNAALIIKDHIIEKIISNDELKHYPNIKKIELSANYHLIPGFIDLHIHGANGKDVMDGNADALATISQALAKEGTTSYLATTMSAKPDDIENVLRVVKDYQHKQQDIIGAEVLGVHLEGPFLSPKKVGAQRSDLILAPNKELVERWQTVSNNIIKLMTFAPELPNSLEFIEFLQRKKIVPSMGHTDATFNEAMTAIAAGCHYVTHLFNAMRGMHQREPGVVTAALLSKDVSAELIVDGIHLHPAIVELALKIKGEEKLVLVTDAMRAKCLPDGQYELGGQAVNVKHGAAMLADETLAGSTLKMSDAIVNMMKFTKCDLAAIIKMAAENPAKILGIFSQKGSIAPNKDADIVVLDDKCNVVLTICRGKIV